MSETMHYRSPRTVKFLLDGAARIVTVPGMDRTWRSIDAGSIASDWQAVGDDWRRSMRRKGDRVVG